MMATRRNPDLTRNALLQAAFEEIYRSGFQAASLETILSSAGVTKGALYHHFGSKKELGYAVVDEVIRNSVFEAWIDPLDRAEDPIGGLLEIVGQMPPRFFSPHLGCPLNNLAQEMSPLDEGFRERVKSVFGEWRDAISRALRRGQERGQVRNDIDPSQSADFILAALEGSVSLAKNAQEKGLLANCKVGLETYLASLRPRGFRKRSSHQV